MSTVQSTAFSVSVSVEADRATVTVVVAGGIDVASAYELEAPALDLVERGFARVSIDLGAVDFIDSTGLRALLRLREQAEQQGTELVLIMPRQRALLRIFDVTGTYGLFNWREE